MAQWFSQGGFTMWFILFASIAGATEALYCLYALSRARAIPHKIAEAAGSVTRDTAEGVAELCRRIGGPFAAVVLAAIENRDLAREDAENLVEAAGRRAAHVLGRGVLVLEVVAAVTPLLGLFGTVVGMQEAFDHISSAGMKTVGSLPEGISKALITTIFGLLVGIPAYVLHCYFQRRVDERLLEMEHHALRVLSRLRR